MDKYIVLAISVVLLIGIFAFFNVGEDESLIGFADNIQESNSGYVFYIHLENGNEIKSFYTEKPDDSLHKFFGKYSEDGSIFFVSCISNV